MGPLQPRSPVPIAGGLRDAQAQRLNGLAEYKPSGVRGILHRDGSVLSVVVDIINVEYVSVGKAKSPASLPQQSPPKNLSTRLSADATEYRACPYIGHGAGCVEPCEDIAQLDNVLGHHAARVVFAVWPDPSCFKPTFAPEGCFGTCALVCGLCGPFASLRDITSLTLPSVRRLAGFGHAIRRPLID